MKLPNKLKNKLKNKIIRIDDEILDRNEIRTHLRANIYQINPLIQARKQMGAIELKIFILGLQGVNPHVSSKDKYYDKEFKTLFIPVIELVKIFGHTQYLTEIKSVCNTLIKSYIELNEDDGGFTLFNVFYRLKYIPKEGLYIRFHDDLRPYILDLYENKGYTKYSVGQIFKLSSAYAIRLCELMLQFRGMSKQNIIERTISVEDLRFSLNVPEQAYERIENFKKRVLDEPIAEINKKTEYDICYRQVKYGRKVTAFTFFMDITKVLEAEKLEGTPENKDDIVLYTDTEAITKLSELGYTVGAAKAILKTCDNSKDLNERLEYALECYKENKKPVSSKLGYIRKAIEENWLAKKQEKDKLYDEAHEIWKQTKINQTTIEQELLKYLERNPPKNEDGSQVKRLLRAPEVEQIRFAVLSKSAEEISKAFSLLEELNWSWKLFREMYNV